MERLQPWLKEQCDKYNLSWRDASLKAGLNPGAISAIMGGTRPGLETCKKIAGLFNVSSVFILELAGHIDVPPSPLPQDPLFHELTRLWPQLNNELKRATVNLVRHAAGHNPRK